MQSNYIKIIFSINDISSLEIDKLVYNNKRLDELIGPGVMLDVHSNQVIRKDHIPRRPARNITAT